METSANPRPIMKAASLAALGVLACSAAWAGPGGGKMSGKIVWVDVKNAALLVECQDSEGCKEVKGKKGETYTLIIPENLKSKAASWKEGGQVKVDFEDRQDGGRALKSVSYTK